MTAWRIQYLSAQGVPCGEIYLVGDRDRMQEHRRISGGLCKVDELVVRNHERTPDAWRVGSVSPRYYEGEDAEAEARRSDDASDGAPVRPVWFGEPVR